MTPSPLLDDLDPVLEAARGWLRAGHRVAIATVARHRRWYRSEDRTRRRDSSSYLPRGEDEWALDDPNNSPPILSPSDDAATTEVSRMRDGRMRYE